MDYQQDKNNPWTKVKHPQIIRDLMVLAFRIDNCPDWRADQKINKLTELAKKFRTGWPFGTNKVGVLHPYADYGRDPRLPEYRNLLENYASQIADRIHRLDLAKNGRNIGKFDTLEGDAPKVVSTK